MKIYLEKAIFVNRAPFDKLELDFNENEIAVLSSVNGKGKTTILSHIADAFYEIAKHKYKGTFKNYQQYYRVSSSIYNLNMNNPSFVYFRFKNDDEYIDYIDIRNYCTEEIYNNNIFIKDKIPYNKLENSLKEIGCVKKVSEKVTTVPFTNNVITYFPSYRYEQPGYLNDQYKVNLNFNISSLPTGHLKNPIEVVSDLPEIANWIMDVTLDRLNNPTYPTNKSELHDSINKILTYAFISKIKHPVRFGIAPRNQSLIRLQIVDEFNNQLVYPSIFNLSSGESSLLCIFCEILRQADNIKNNIPLSEITGIVLIDEIDKHLHITLLKEVLPQLFSLFPNVQFIVSSHSPFLNMGLAEETPDRSKIIDLDYGGITTDPTSCEQYIEVYNMMIKENDRFKDMYKSINNQIENNKVLQIVSEGKNTEHIEQAIKIIEPSLLEQIKVIKGSEDKSGDQQLKNAFDIMSKANHNNKFLFVWDCDSNQYYNKVVETNNFFKFCFEKNNQNQIAEKGIENLYPGDLFTDDVYIEKNTQTEYGGSKTEKKFDKTKFLIKIKKESSINSFDKFKPLISKIKSIIESD